MKTDQIVIRKNWERKVIDTDEDTCEKVNAKIKTVSVLED